MVNWSNAPKGAVDVRKSYTGSTHYTNGTDKFFSYDTHTWVPMNFTNHDWPIVEKGPTAVPPDSFGKAPSTPDWSKAPSDATHWGIVEGKSYFWEVHGLYSTYYFDDGQKFMFIYSPDDDKCRAFAASLTPRPTSAADFVKRAVDKETERLQREVMTAVPFVQQPQNPYDREIIGKYGTGKCIVDVYRVLYAFGPLPPEIQHAIKKLAAPGKRGAKDERQDLLEAIQSIEARLQYLEACDD